MHSTVTPEVIDTEQQCKGRALHSGDKQPALHASLQPVCGKGQDVGGSGCDL